nr:stage II sporulation protein R [Caldicoprobacter guelmensis]
MDIYGNATQKEYIRFHVVANSDSPEDQALKLRVRDKLLEEFGKEFAGIDSIEKEREKVMENIDEIEKIALLEVKRAGKSYPVKVQFGRFSFPTKAYGNLVLPAGEYEALKVVIGKGEGANWWCVMFPPLCFIDISHGVARPKENATARDDNASQVDGAVKVEGNQSRRRAITSPKSINEGEKYVVRSEANDNEVASNGIKGRSVQQDDVEDRQRVSMPYNAERGVESSGEIQYRWKLVEWIEVSSNKIKRLFSFLSFWDR